ncbi:M23 family metallopeptidase [Virgibacillus doumboii]|uniref:M23 family metallopeptidase n=1 Tax=Virgibacillus doumboii TaxID=2697503 RepID=UPI0013E0B343|nr:M23 family metallopeptidase [Virgibacillus doumboii]
MKEENNGTPKNKWSRIFRKKWFFPAVYLTIAALLLSVVIWYQNLDNQIQETGDEPVSDNYSPEEFDQDAQPVMDQQEVIKMPVVDQEQAEIVTKFYDYNADQKDKESALILYNNRFYQSTGIDIAHADGETFDVLASLSGTVEEVKEDPLYGNVVTLSHGNDVVTYYASMGEVNVKDGDKVQQGDVLGTAGESIFGKDNGTHVHFEIRKNGDEVNPEEFFNQPVSALGEASSESESTESESTESEGTESEGTEEGNTDESSDAESEDANSDQSGNTTEDPNQQQESDDTSQDDTSQDEQSDENSDGGTTDSSDTSGNA